MDRSRLWDLLKTQNISREKKEKSPHRYSLTVSNYFTRNLVILNLFLKQKS